ncbi:MAG: VWA domain-containing protein [Lachnospiraceae bacterium]|nr:VWA domain-containing protein [Lachnospiraceae bacterium]
MKTTNIKKVSTVVTAVIMTASMLAGCGIDFKASTAAAPMPSENVYYTDTEPEAYCEAPAAADESIACSAPAGNEDMIYYGCYASTDETEEYAAECYDSYDGYDSYANSASAESEKNYLMPEMKKSDSYLGSAYDFNGRDSRIRSNSEEYSEFDEHGYMSVKNHPLSTFAADVDTASYSNLRRMLTEGYRLRDIPEGAVRIEEMINYFNYDYKGPKGSDPFGVNAELSYCPWNEDALLMSIGLKTEDIDYSEAPDSNLVFLIDVSGSMAGNDRLELLKDAFSMLVDELSEKDRVSIVTYANGVDTVLKGATGDEKRKIKNAIRDLEASGGTNGGDGIITAYKVAEKYFIKGGNNRIILATDGDLNLGLTSVDELQDLVSKKKESGVFLSVLGFGSGNIKDNRMETLADNGNGNYSYIDSEKEAKKLLVDELCSNMLTICKDVKLQVEFNPEVVKGYRLLGYDNRVMKDRDFNDDKKDGGEIGAGHEVTVLYEIIPTAEYSGIKYRGLDEKILSLDIRFKRPAEDTSSLLSYPITFEAFNSSPSDEFEFKSAVAEFGLLASDSLFAADADLDNVIDRLESIDLDDDYKTEFYKLISNL